MRIQDKDFYYGAALTQIAEFPSYTAINKISAKNGLFQLNDDKKFLVKYSSDESEWKFTFRNNDFEELCDWEYYLVLICSGETICLLDRDDISKVVDINNESPQWISVTHSSNGLHCVKGSLGELGKMIPQNAFPKNMLGEEKQISEDYAWPELCQIRIYGDDPGTLCSTTDRKFDLADNLMAWYDERSLYFGMSSLSTKWGDWDEINLKKIESLIEYDLEFDGYAVEIIRISDVGGYCSSEFIWKLEVTEEEYDQLDSVEEELDTSLAEEKQITPEVRHISESFPSLVAAKGQSVCSIEVDTDALSLLDKFKYGRWEEFIRKAAANWVNENEYMGKGTIWGWGSPSVNFLHPTYSVFYAVIGMPKEFREHLEYEVKVFGEHVRENSDYVVPNRRDGWNVRCHIQDGKAWKQEDDSCWQEVINTI